MSARDRGLSVYRDLAGDSDRGSSALNCISSCCAVCCSCGGCCCLSPLCRLPTSWWPLISNPARDMFFMVLPLGHRPAPSQDQAAGQLQAFFALIAASRRRGGDKKNQREKTGAFDPPLPSVITRFSKGPPLRAELCLNCKRRPRPFFSTPSLRLCSGPWRPQPHSTPSPRRRGLVGKRWPGRMRIGAEITGSRYRCPPHAHHSPPCAACRCDLARWRRARTHKVRRVVREGAAAACNAHYARPLSGTTRMRWR